MKALVILLAVVLVLANPMAAAVVLAAELAACGVLGALIWRAVRPLHAHPGRHRRRTA